MRALKSKFGPTLVMSNEFQIFERIRMNEGIYEVDLNENELYVASQLRQRGILLRVNQNGKAKYKAYPQTRID